MRVFITGATGYLGAAVSAVLRASGHDVRGLVRSNEAEAKAKTSGIGVARGDLSTLDVLAREAKAADAVIHIAQPPSGDVDAATVKALLSGLQGSGKAFVYTSGCWVYGDTQGRVANEDTALNPLPIVAWRPEVERHVLAAANAGLRTAVVRPGVVYGGGGGIAMMFAQSARETGFARVVGTGENRWPMVHRDDLAELYRLALERAPTGSIWNGTQGTSVRVLDIATSLSRAVGAGKVKLWSVDDARQTLGPFADALALDQLVSGERARQQLGWNPQAPTALVELQRPLDDAFRLPTPYGPPAGHALPHRA